jgi:DNA-binding Lrp family transcriptional regulator
MPTAFVLLNTESGTECDVLRKLKSISNVEEAKIVYGVYDIVLRVESKSMDELKRTVTWKIRKIEYITATQTVIIP